MSLKSVIKTVGGAAINSTPMMKNMDLDRVHSKSILGRILRKEHNEDEDGLIKSTIKGMLGGSYEAASDKSLLGRIRNRNNEDDDGAPDDDNPSGRPILASVVNTAKKVSSPTLTVISRQLQDVVSRVMSIGKHLKKQQDMMVGQASQQERINKENIMEAGHRLLPNEANNDLELTNAFKSLSDRILQVTGSISSGGRGMFGSLMGGLLGVGGLGGAGATAVGAAKAVRLNKGFVAAGSQFRNVATGRFAKAADAIKKPGVIGNLVGKVGATLSSASKLAAASKLGSAAGKVTPLAIKKLALPLAAKAVGRTALKSIPIIGAIAGIGFAAKRLLEGDPLGAGIDAVSGLAGPLTAIPALILSIARDLYTQSYGITPESDPLVGKRMGVVKDGVKLAVEETISPAIKMQQPSRIDNQKALSFPKPNKPAANDNQVKKAQAVPMTPAKVPATPSTKKAASPAKSQSSGGAPAKAPTSKSTAKPKAVSPAPMAPKSSNAKPPVPAKLTAMSSSSISSPNMGKNIAAASIANDTMAMPSPPTDQSSNVPSALPAKSPTTNPSSQGIGNVPDPTYGEIDSFAQLMFFGAAA